LLEEDATYAEGLVRGLSDSGRDVTLLRDGDSGLARVKDESFDVLLVSAELPGINGFRLCGKLRKLPNFNAPIVLMGSDRTVGFEEHQKLPVRAHGYLRKPVVIGELIAMLARITNGSAPPPPARATQRPPPRASQRPPTAPNAAALAKALDRAEEQSTALAELRKRLAGQVELVAQLQNAQRKPPPLPPKKPAEEAAQRELHNKRERELLEARAALDTERHAGIDLRNAVAERDARVRALEITAREQAARTKRAEELATASAQRDVGKKQGESDKQLELIRARAAQERAEAAKTAQAFADELLALRSDLEKERERADGAAKKAVRSSTTADAELERLRQEVTAMSAAAERQDKRVKALTLLAGTGKADLEKERASRVAADRAASAAKEQIDSARRERLGNDVELASKLADATRSLEDVQRARAELETSQAKRLSQLRAHHGVERTKLLEEGRVARASEAELRQELDRRQDEGAERLSRAEEQYVRHMSDVAAREHAQTAAIADAERLREELKTTHTELEAAHSRVTELETALETMFEAQTARRQGAEVEDSTRAKVHVELESLGQTHAAAELALRALDQELGRVRTERERAVAEQAALTEQLAQAERTAKEKVERADTSQKHLRAAHTAEINLLREAHGNAIGARDRALASSLERVTHDTEERVTRALLTEHAAQLARAEQTAQDEAAVEHSAELRELRAETERKLAEVRANEGTRVEVVSTQIAELSRALTSGREALDGERRLRLKNEANLAAQLEALQRQADELRAKLVVSEEETRAMQRSAEQEGITARAALEELEHERTLIAQAKTVLSELVARIDDPNDEAVPSRRSRKR